MATCQSCGSEMTGAYCDNCGARAQEERAAKKSKREAANPGNARVNHAPVHRTPGLFSPQRIWRTTAVALVGVVLYGAGIFTGVYMAQGPASTSAGGGVQTIAAEGAPDLSGMPPLARANFYMESGVSLMNDGQRSAAVSEFRKSLKEWEAALAEEPDSLYAQTYMGLTYYYAGDSKQALETLRTVLEKDANYLWAIFNLAWIYETSGKNTEATIMYQRYLNAAPTEKENMLKYAEQLELIDRQVEAAQDAIERMNGGGTGK